MNKYSTSKIPAKWFIRISHENLPRLQAYLKANSHKYEAYTDSWRVVMAPEKYFLSEGKYYHSTGLKEKAKEDGYTEITDTELKRLLLSGMFFDARSANKFPEKWFIKGGYELEKMLQAESYTPNVGGHLKDNGYFITSFEKKPQWSFKLLGSFSSEAVEISVQDFKYLMALRDNSKDQTIVEKQGLPEKWFIRGGSTEFIGFMETQQTIWKGDGNLTGYFLSKQSIWNTAPLKTLIEGGYTEISFNDYIQSITNNKIRKIMQTTPEIIKEVLVTKPVKIKTIKKDKPVYIEREVTIYVGVDEGNEVFTGYSIRNPEFDKKHDEAMAAKIAKNRAFNSKTNLSRGEWITAELKTKFVLKGIAEQFFSKISKGQVLQISKA